MTGPDHGHYLTTDDVARLLQVKKTTVRFWLRNRLLNGVKIGKEWRVPAEEIEKRKGNERRHG